MKTRLNKTEAAKIDFLKSVGKEDFSLCATFSRGEEMMEAIRLENYIPGSDRLSAIKVKDVPFILITTKTFGIIVNSVGVQNGGRFEVHEMSNEAFGRYEEHLRKALSTGGKNHRRNG